MHTFPELPGMLSEAHRTVQFVGGEPVLDVLL